MITQMMLTLIIIYKSIVPSKTQGTLLKVADLNKDTQYIQGIIPISNEKSLLLIQEENMYEMNCVKNSISKLSSNPIDKSSVILKGRLFDNNVIIGFGEHLLYFVDFMYNKLGSYIDYSTNDEDIFGNTILETNTKNNKNEVLIGYAKKFTFNGDYEVSLQIFNINEKNKSFQLYKTLLIGGEYSYNGNSFNFIGCKFVENGITILCAISNPTTSSIDIKTILLNTTKPSFITKKQITSYKSVSFEKIAENTTCLYSESSDKRNWIIEFYFTSNGEVQTLKTLSGEGHNGGFILRKDTQTVFYIEKNPQKLQNLQGKIFRYISNQIKFTTFSFSVSANSINEFLPNVINGNLAVFFRNDDTAYHYIEEIPDCNDPTVTFYSYQEKVIGFNSLSPGIDSSKYEIAEAISSKGVNFDISKKTEFTYSAAENGNDLILYYLKSRTSSEINSRYCSVTIHVCNAACKNCKEYSSNSKKTKCEVCGSSYRPVYDDLTQCFHAKNGQENYYLNKTLNMFKPCHQNCTRCDGDGTDSHPNCLSCHKDLFYYPSSKRCDCNINKNTWVNNNGVIFCVDTCPEYKPFENTGTNECVVECPKEVYFLKDGKRCVSKCPEGKIEEYFECKKTMNDIIASIDDNILELSKNNPKYNVTNSKYEIFEITDDKKKDQYDTPDTSVVDLGECEKIIREKYNIPRDEPLLMFKLDLEREDHISGQIEYSVYTKDGKKIDLSVCGNQKISVSVPITTKNETIREWLEQAGKLAEYGYDMFSSSDPFYTDICARYTSEQSTDITLEDRKKDFYKNISLCEEGCEYKSINLTSNKITCECNVKTEVSTKKTGFSFNELSNSFKSIMSNSNIKVIKCYQLVFNGGIFVKNFGSWISLITILSEIVFFAVYLTFGNKDLEEIMKNILKRITNEVSSIFSKGRTPAQSPRVDARKLKSHFKVGAAPVSKGGGGSVIIIGEDDDFNSEHFSENEVNIEVIETGFIQRKVTNISSKTTTFPEVQSDSGLYCNYSERGKKVVGSEVLLLTSKFRPSSGARNQLISVDKRSMLSSRSIETFRSETKVHLQDNAIISFPHITKSKKFSSLQKLPKVKSLSVIPSEDIINCNFTDEELNDMKLNQAVLYDKRGFLRMYYSFLKYDQLIIFTFINASDFNLRILKIALFFFMFILFITVNVLFYTDSSISNNYKKKGIFDFVYALPQTLFSSMACAALNLLLTFLSLSNSSIKKLKKKKDRIEAEKMSRAILTRLKVKNVIFFCLVIILLCLFWYYNAAFCAVYKNTQVNIILNTLMSFVISMLEPFGICLVAAIARILALKTKSRVIYFIAKLLEML